MKKKAIKIAAASAVAASAFVASAPLQSNAASNVGATVDQAVNQMKAAYHTYSDVTTDGTFADLATVYKQYNAAKVAYANATAAVKKAGGAQKDAYLAKLDSNYNTLIKGRVVTYIDAYKYAKSLEGYKKDLADALTAKEWNKAEAGYHKISYELKTRTVILDRVYGKTARELLRSEFKASAQTLRDSIAQEVTAKIALAAAQSAVDSKDLAVAKAQLDKAATALGLADKDSEFTKALVAQAATVNAAYEALVTPAVESVSAINATQVEVKFNNAVDAIDVTTNFATLFTIDGQSAASVLLSTDGKTATLTFSAASKVEKTDGVVVVNPVKTAANTDLKTSKYTSLLTYTDTVKPEIATVTSTTKGTTATSLTVTATEPVSSAFAKVDGQYVTVNFGGTKSAVITGLSLDATKPHTIELLNVTDTATNANVTVSTTKSFNVTVDASAPSATLSANGDKQILVTFSKPMDVNSVDAAFGLNAGVADESLTTVNHTAVTTAVAGTNDTQFLIPVTSALYTNTASRTLTVVFPATIQDKLGNAIVTGTKTVTLTKDTVKPVATGYKVVKDNLGNVTALEVNFSEGITGVTPAAPSIVDANGVDVSSTFLGGLTPAPAATGNKKVVYNAAAPAKVSGKFAFSFGPNLVSDQAEVVNNSDAFNYTIDFGTSTATFSLPVGPPAPVISAYNATTNVNTITVGFGTHAVKGGAVANSATDVSNYTLGGKPLPAGTTITLNSGQTQAIISIPAGTISTTDANSVFTVANIKSLAGESLNTWNGTVSLKDSVQPLLNSASLTGDNKLTIGFNEILGTAPALGDLVVKVNGSTVVTTTPGGGTTLTVSNGAGSDTGKYLLNLDALVKQGAAEIPGNAGIDTIPGNADDVPVTPATPTYFDVNNNGVYNAGTDIKIADGPVANFTFTSSSAITGVTVTTLATGSSTAKDAGNLNSLKNGVSATAK